LEANADAIRLATQNALDPTGRIEKFGDVKAKLQALPPAAPRWLKSAVV
jgi:hypothetical protein